MILTTHFHFSLYFFLLFIFSIPLRIFCPLRIFLYISNPVHDKHYNTELVSLYLRIASPRASTLILYLYAVFEVTVIIVCLRPIQHSRLRPPSDIFFVHNIIIHCFQWSYIVIIVEETQQNNMHNTYTIDTIFSLTRTALWLASLRFSSLQLLPICWMRFYKQIVFRYNDDTMVTYYIIFLFYTRTIFYYFLPSACWYTHQFGRVIISHNTGVVK